MQTKTHKIEKLNFTLLPDYLVRLVKSSKKLVLLANPLNSTDVGFVLINVHGCEKVTYEDFAFNDEVYFWYKFSGDDSFHLSYTKVVDATLLASYLLPLDGDFDSDSFHKLTRVLAMAPSSVIDNFLLWCTTVHEDQYPTPEEAMEYLINL